MYTGAWGQDFVKTVQREGGKVTIDDMEHYRVVWSEPLSTTFAAIGSTRPACRAIPPTTSCRRSIWRKS